MLELIGVTLAIIAGCNLLGGLFSCLLLYTKVLDRRKIQHQTCGAGVFWRRVPLIGLNLSVVAALTAAGLTLGYGVFDFQWQGTLAVIAQFLLLVCLDDAWFYWWHRSLHRHPYLYRKIHHIHHRAQAPSPMDYIYVHPLEWLVRTMGYPIGIGAIYLVNGSVSVHAYWVFAFWLNFHEVCIHSGLRTFLAHRIPFFATSERHDRHHLERRGNYASTFTIWDRLLKTTVREGPAHRPPSLVSQE